MASDHPDVSFRQLRTMRLRTLCEVCATCRPEQAQQTEQTLFDHLISGGEQLVRHCEADDASCLDIDD
jgi:hypothetical protein